MQCARHTFALCHRSLSSVSWLSCSYKLTKCVCLSVGLSVCLAVNQGGTDSNPCIQTRKNRAFACADNEPRSHNKNEVTLIYFTPFIGHHTEYCVLSVQITDLQSPNLHRRFSSHKCCDRFTSGLIYFFKVTEVKM